MVLNLLSPNQLLVLDVREGLVSCILLCTSVKSNANAYDQSSVVIYTCIIEVSFVRYSVMYTKLILILVLRKV